MNRDDLMKLPHGTKIIDVRDRERYLGISIRMREYNPNIRIIGITPALGVKIQGIRNPKEPVPSVCGLKSSL